MAGHKMIIKNAHKIPKEVVPLLEKHTRILGGSLPNKLVGVYLHGSAAIGGFNPEQSDVDYLAVVSEPLAIEERQRLATAFLAIYGEGTPANSVEMSIVLETFTGHGFRYPTPYEFHMGTREQIELHGRPHTAEMTDSDLAAHFTITKSGGSVYLAGRSTRSLPRCRRNTILPR